MKYAILSDVHANYEALGAVVCAALEQRPDQILLLGDLVGYGASPNECLDFIRDHGFFSIAGNHDRAAAGLFEPTGFGRLGRRALYWTRSELVATHVAYLSGLPTTTVVDGAFLAVHAALHPEPDVHLHLSTRERVRASLEALRKDGHGIRLAFFGHTHRGEVHRLGPGGELTTFVAGSAARGEPIALDAEAFYLVNPGSVGQPRDGDPRAAFLTFDAAKRTVVHHRIDYDYALCREKVARAGLIYEAGAFERRLDAVSGWIEAGAAALARRFS